MPNIYYNIIAMKKNIYKSSQFKYLLANNFFLFLPQHKIEDSRKTD